MSRSFFILAGGLGAVGLIVWFSRKGETLGDAASALGDAASNLIQGIGAGFLELGKNIGSQIGELGEVATDVIFGPEPEFAFDIPGPLQDVRVTLARRLSEPPYSMTSARALEVALDIWDLVEMGNTIDQALLERGYPVGPGVTPGTAPYILPESPPAPSPAVSVILNP